MAYSVVIGIPSYNEADSIGRVLKETDVALQELGLVNNCIIVNVDNMSSDGTVEIFNSTPTQASKASFKSLTPGKGSNVKMLAEYVVHEERDGLIIVDSDLSYVEPSWINDLYNGLAAGYDTVFARRPPLWNRGDLTYQLCFPALAALRGIRIREPIAPTQAYSKKTLRLSLEYFWDEDILGFGVDIFLASMAEKGRWAEAIMPLVLQHKLRSFTPSLDQALTRGPKFGQVLRTIRNIAQAEPHKKYEVAQESIVGPRHTFSFAPVIRDEEYEYLTDKTFNALDALTRNLKLPSDLRNLILAEAKLRATYIGISWATWQKALKSWMFDSKTTLDAHSMEVLLLSRCVGFYHELMGRSDWYEVVESQVNEFLEHSNIS